ncbi:Bestrophin, RFP-TM, chloride channel-domain-containing protein [Fimicolochytrium jonesii]|uniref:Bestrophin, RFP-TM, chloride channel-domain-containing protein n=1 Tax=Fimicolochytrium jonesii TaxID=1396493 RepID=UPI0022FDF0DE|nr:Bestrophin, RFP-TM, chloride channel-domain-containing protein [Fimicolochytrium jonesii]KAI8816252.1 Bestrophin, RFP-TM, chloride channel-domain-containing protein [Fimicolochytrium jonesii]
MNDPPAPPSHSDCPPQPPLHTRWTRFDPFSSTRNLTGSFNYLEALIAAIRYNHTILPKIAPVVGILGVWSSVVVILYKGGWSVAVDDKLIAILGVSLAMLLAFRSNRGFERYWSGAQLWTSLSTQIRNLARLIWNGVSIPPTDSSIPSSAGIDDIHTLAHTEKLQVMRLLLGVAVATKFALRGQNALEMGELRGLLPGGGVGLEGRSWRSSLVDLQGEGGGASITGKDAAIGSGPTGTGSGSSTGMDATPASGDTPDEKGKPPQIPLRPHTLAHAHTHPRPRTDSLTYKVPPMIFLRNRSGTLSKTPSLLPSSASVSHHPPPPDSHTSTSTSKSPSSKHPSTSPPHTHQPPPSSLVINAPLDLIHRISAYIRRQRKLGRVDAEDSPLMSANVGAVVETISRFEQILYVPMPLSYDTHLKQILLLYFLFLPLQLVRSMGWLVVGVTVVASVAFFGVDAIAGEIEEPFGVDENDLPIDYFLLKLRGDIEYIMEMPLGHELEDDDADDDGAGTGVLDDDGARCVAPVGEGESKKRV